MKTSAWLQTVGLALLLEPALNLHAIVLTNNLLIGITASEYEGLDVVVSNAVLTVDGPHAFNSLRLAAGATLTHSAAPDGTLPLLATVTDEVHILTDTNPVTLAQSEILLMSVLVRDTNNLVTYTNDVDYVLSGVGQNLSLQRTINSLIPDGETVLVSYDFQAHTNSGLSLTVSNNLEIETGAVLDAAHRGSAGGAGFGGSAGSPATGAGGGHGGVGGATSTGAQPGLGHDLAQSPIALGSSGGSGAGGAGGLGGGTVRLVVGGNCRVNGLITCDGQSATNTRAGGGSGGSVWISAQTLSGGGSISVNGGTGEPIHGGGGGGGRIALNFATYLFAGSLSAYGGDGWQRGGAGTIFLRTNGTSGIVILDNGGQPGAASPLNFTDTPSLILQGRASGIASNSQNLAALLVRSNSSITTAATNNATLFLTIAGDAKVETGALISVAGRGYSPNAGPGSGVSSSVGSGAGHGGYGGSGIAGAVSAAGGNYYGSITGPTTLGSGGRSVGAYFGGAGGGAVRISVVGKLQLDGKLSADAMSGGATLGGGGAGGSVWLALNTFTGSGSISANGGKGGGSDNGGGGGSGGRIAVTFNTNLFTGHLTAFGGDGGVPGGPGTIYTKTNAASFADLRYDNNGRNGTNAVLDSTFPCNLQVTGATALRTPFASTLFFGNLDIASASSFLPNSGGSSVNVSGNLTVAVGGLITSDGLGAPAGSGAGPGQYHPSGSGGGGHGGMGGRGLGGAGGNAYESSSSATVTGSGGGGTSSTGGAGGGALSISCSGLARLDGWISARGLSTFTNNAGGGSGGSVRLSLNRFTGTGTITADGGNGHLPNGGGGGGGRIAITWNSNSFSGVYSAKGGLGYNPGGAGTIYLRANNATYPDLIVDNGGTSGSNALTVLDLSSLSNLTVRAGGSLTSSIANMVLTGELDIQSDALLIAAGNLTISGAVNIAGRLAADGTATGNPGNGQYTPLGSGGGGHGGYGGRGVAGAGGNSYDFALGPGQAGSLGGSPSSSYGGLGGGFLRLTANGPLTLNGSISANGLGNTNASAGGGSGGAIYLLLTQFSGEGAITANGGPGSAISGGGGGGRIAVYYNTNAFTGTISARGGNGYQTGGAGTIYLRNNGQRLQDFICDNGGLSGTNTPLALQDVSSGMNLTVSGGAILRPNSSSSIGLSKLTVATNSTLLAGSSALNLSLAGPALIEAGGSISTDGQGFTSSSGLSGSGGVTTAGGSGGGGHAGYGGRGAGSAPRGGGGTGGNANDSLFAPTISGGGGGGLNSSGGAGGGVINITASAPITLNGLISANGLSCSSNNAGGGAGGTVRLTLNRQPLLGSGDIRANGGSGHLPYGGGGGGGRIALSYDLISGGNQTPSNGFTGILSAQGGNGFQQGGAGTIWLRTNSVSTPVVFVDNGGGRGTNTYVAGQGGYDLFVQGGAKATSLGTPRDLFVRPDSSVAQTGNLLITRNATVDAGGGINLDGLSSSGQGTGQAKIGAGGGAGHGGYGALNSGSAGGAYDSVISPAQPGSPGGNGSGSAGLAPYGGPGGGAMQLSVGSTLLVNGTISADGLDGDLNSGGGSGGSLRLQVQTLAGNGAITARGGNGQGPAGGGGGGRIALYFTTNLFTGTVSACAGAGGLPGGAGTIYLRNAAGQTSLLLDNCGLNGTNTPLSSTFGLATDLSVSRGAIGEFQGGVPPFSNLVVTSGGAVTARRTDTNLFLALLGDLMVGSGSRIFTDAQGFTYGLGPGAGTNLLNQGSGGGYGGEGGASGSGALGGLGYGSEIVPADRGSGGGSSGGNEGGSEGGGAFRLAVAGTLSLNGAISANGAMGLQDDAGGGAGGSIWISVGRFHGDGTLSAIGGDGELFGGGGGGGGRIAVYSPSNTFTGLVSVAGGYGALNGGPGTIFTSGNLPSFDVVSQSPLGLLHDAANLITLEFSEPINPHSVGVDDFILRTPYGMLDTSNFVLSFPAPAVLRISFPTQNVPGEYRLEAGPGIESLLAVPMSQTFTGVFTAVMPQLSGTVTDTNGVPVAGVVLAPSGGLIPTTTDTNGSYALGVPQNWSGTVAPSFGDFMFAPGLRSYLGLTESQSVQDFQMVTTIATNLRVAARDGTLMLNWDGRTGLTYQVYWATNLDSEVWVSLDSPMAGTNHLMQLELPVGAEPERYFRLSTRN